MRSMDPVSMLRHMGGVARVSGLEGAGVNRNHLRRALDAGVVERPVRGCIALPGTPWTHTLATYFDARVSCLSACDAHGLRMLRQVHVPHLELHAERGGHRSASGPHRMAYLHRTRTFEPGDLVVPPARAIDMASHCTTPLGQLVVLDHALASGLVRAQEIDSFSITPLVQRRWLRHMSDAGAGSVSETCARVALRRAGLSLVTQAPFAGGRRADFLVEDRLYVEVDGYEFHADRRQFGEDRARDRHLMGLGYRVIRFTYGDAVKTPELLVKDVRAALAAQVR